jgi:hypothetical protein
MPDYRNLDNKGAQVAERQVVFYECQNVPEQTSFDRLAAVEDINALEDEDWQVPDDESDLAVIVDDPGTSTKPSLLRLLRIRSDRPFKLSAARQLTPVEVAANEAITEFTWVVIWKDHFAAGVSSRDAPPGVSKGGKVFPAYISKGVEDAIKDGLINEPVQAMLRLQHAAPGTSIRPGLHEIFLDEIETGPTEDSVFGEPMFENDEYDG